MIETTIELCGPFCVRSDPRDGPGLICFNTVVAFSVPWKAANFVRDRWERGEKERLTVKLPSGAGFVGVVWNVATVPLVRGDILEQQIEIAVEKHWPAPNVGVERAAEGRPLA